jgi:hypothetical protein
MSVLGPTFGGALPPCARLCFSFLVSCSATHYVVFSALPIILGLERVGDGRVCCNPVADCPSGYPDAVSTA